MAWRFSNRRRTLILMYFMFIVANTITCTEPLIISQIVNSAINRSPDLLREPLLWTALYGVATIAFWLFHGPARVLERRGAFQIQQAFITDLYAKISELPLGWHVNNHSSDSVSRITRASRGLFEFSGSQSMAIMVTTRFVVSIVSLSIYSPIISALSIITTLLTFRLLSRFDRRLMPLLRRVTNGEHHVNTGLGDYIGNMTTIVNLRLRSRTQSELGRRFIKYNHTSWLHSALIERKWAVINFCLVLSQVAIIAGYVGVNIALNSAISPGSVVAVFQFLLMINMMFFQSITIIGNYLNQYSDVRSVEKILDAHSCLKRNNIFTDFPRVWTQISIRNLSYSYEKTSNRVHGIRDVSLEIRSGRKIAVVGTSGAGKSTLLALIRGLLVSSSANMLVDGKEYENLSILSNMSSLVTQEAEIFENTILFNLTLGESILESVLNRAIYVSAFDSVVKSIPKRFMHDLREGGVNLSGGQKQRLALARGLIASSDSSLLLLDEPTSSVDLHTESEIFRRLFIEFPELTCIVTLHRLHLLRNFDEIWVLKDGSIVDRGTFDQVMSCSDAFQLLWNSQEWAEIDNIQNLT